MLPIQGCAADSIFVYDPAQLHVSVFSPAGRFARLFDVRKWGTDGLPPYDFWCHPSGVAAFIHRSSQPPAGEGPVRPSVQISILIKDSSFALATVPATERYYRSGTVFPRHLGMETTVVPNAGIVYVGTGDGYSIARYSVRGGPLAPIQEVRPAVAVTSDQIQEYVRQFIANTPSGVNTQGYELWFQGIEFPKYYPAYRGLLVDDMDDLWVEEYPIPGVSQGVWQVFSPAGLKLATVALPASFRLAQAGKDFVLGVYRDEDDVDYVRMYQLRRN